MAIRLGGSNLIYGVIFVLIVATLAVVGYMLNGWSSGDSLFMVVLTIFTVGYEEVHPLDTMALRVVTIALIVLGCTGMIYLTGALVQFITFTQLQQVRGQTRMNKQIDELKNHVHHLRLWPHRQHAGQGISSREVGFCHHRDQC